MSTIEHDVLSMCVRILKFQRYLLGTLFFVEVDHKQIAISIQRVLKKIKKMQKSCGGCYRYTIMRSLYRPHNTTFSLTFCLTIKFETQHT